ncbi:MAG: hypothetical protein LBJ41_03790 [Treponema sp.]|jgi:hypothetical protein|nr:hypothetical protein [Treponema sp.]
MSDMTIEPQMGLTFEQVWAALMELRKEHAETEQFLKENSEDFDRRLQENERLLKESSAEFDRRMRKSEQDFNRRIGHLDNRFGELAEHLVAPNIVKKFNALGYHFNDVAKERKFYHEDGNLAAEFDILLENRESAAGVEVKSKPTERDIDEHIERLEFLRRRKDELGDKRKICGAIAGAIMPESVRRAALRAGLYVIEQSGDTVQIEEPDEVRGW